MAFDYLIVGAGFSGCVLAERLSRVDGKRVLLIDKRPHIAGNAYDHFDEAGVQVHKYGPHIFHTNSKQIFDHLSKFTEWRFYEHRVLAEVDGMQVPIPINLDTVNKLYGLNLTSEQLQDWFAERILGREMLDNGIMGWMADFGEYLPTDLRLADGSDPMEAHNRWLREGFDAGVFLLSGSLPPGLGGAILARGASRVDLDARVAADPFVSEGVVTAEVIEIAPGRVDPRLAFLVG